MSRPSATSPPMLAGSTPPPTSIAAGSASVRPGSGVHIEGQTYEQYALIWDFANEVKRSNPGSTVVIGTNDATDENRHFIGVNGSHLKGPHGGVLLSTVGIDLNNSNFPIAIAIVNNESCETWGWFLSLLKLDLNIEKDYEWAFMSDKQKGLIQVFNEVFPKANHRFCLRHLHGNFKTTWFRGEAFKNALWKCGTTTTVNEFMEKMTEMRDIDSSATDWFNDKPPMHWSEEECEAFAASSLRTRPSEVESVVVASGHQDGSYARNTSTILDFMEAGRRNRP
ncbi:hypothetical protein ZIOFF_051608 [Zingiber officinale]|uniref:MULE transposase domain-containing protein n=1 Tax=Zingiber officinale TaxID=94328 RepID=A0A8J5FMB6_ZINOF|nr:hypothetical protein ZIOFF_051608 [Zingiber officinale]